MNATIIAFMGGDGSGKTTSALNIIGRLTEMGLSPEYAKPFEEFFLLKFFLKIIKKKYRAVREKFFRRELKNSIYLKIWPYLVLIDQFFYYLYIKLFKRNKIIISDRYTYDFLVSWEYYGCNNRIISWLYTSFPKPDLGIIFVVDPRVALDRKKNEERVNLNLEFFTVHMEEHLKLAKRLNFKVINTEKPIDKTTSEILLELRRFFISKLCEEDKLLVLLSAPDFCPEWFHEFKISFNWNKIRWKQVMDFSVKNGVEYIFLRNLLTYFSKNMPENATQYLNKALEICESHQEKVLKTLKVILSIFKDNNIEYIIFKTLAPFDYLPTDVDILVKKESFERTKVFLEQVYPKQNFERMHNSISITGRKDLLPVDLHYEISWLNCHPIDEELIWKRRRKVDFMGEEVFVPSKEDEILILMAHSIFQHHYTTLGEFYYITKLADNVDLEYILEQVTKHNWRYSFQKLFSLLLLKHDFLYNSNYRKRYDSLNYYHYVFNLEPLYFHPWDLFLSKDLNCFLDLILTILRRIRFKVNKELPYNANWLKNLLNQ